MIGRLKYMNDVNVHITTNLRKVLMIVLESAQMGNVNSEELIDLLKRGEINSVHRLMMLCWEKLLLNPFATGVPKLPVMLLLLSLTVLFLCAVAVPILASLTSTANSTALRVSSNCSAEGDSVTIISVFELP